MGKVDRYIVCVKYFQLPLSGSREDLVLKDMLDVLTELSTPSLGIT